MGETHKSSVEVWLWLLMVMQPFNSKTNYILSQCDFDAAEACRAIRDGKLPFLKDKEKRRAGEVRTGTVREVMKLCAEHGVRIVTMDDDEYPKRLRTIDKPPIVLFVAGSLDGLDDAPAISVVGSRNVTDYTLKATEFICKPLADSGTAIVSGLAVGSDTAAHKACLDAGGRTVGVAACGILANYPIESADLKRKIVDSGGAIVSELLPNSNSFRSYFHERNRIISGISMGTLVVQAAQKSGTLLTASHALQQGRALFCIPPHDISAAEYTGNAELLRQGATVVCGAEDIVDWLSENCEDNEELERRVERVKTALRQKSAPKIYNEPKNADDSDGDSQKPEKPKKTTPKKEVAATLSEDEVALYKLLCEQPSDIDLLMEKADFDYGKLTELLTNLEIEGNVTRTREGVYEVR